MNLQLTPEQILRDTKPLLEALAQLGYVIVHPDDVPTGRRRYAEKAGDKILNAYWDAKVRGWDECRERVLGQGHTVEVTCRP